MKRFYQHAHYSLTDNLFYFYLDDKPIKTPMGNLLSTPSLPKAQIAVQEWLSQGDIIKPDTMPMTKYLNSVTDKIKPNYNTIIIYLLNYADNDCIFYFTDKVDSDLHNNQLKYWLPIIKHFSKYYAVDLYYGSDLTLPNQCDDYKNHLKDFFQSLSHEDLAGLYNIITILGSVLLALSAYHNHIHYNDALKYSRLEEDFNIQNWGLDLEAEKKRNSINQDYHDAITFLSLK